MQLCREGSSPGQLYLLCNTTQIDSEGSTSISAVWCAGEMLDLPVLCCDVLLSRSAQSWLQQSTMLGVLHLAPIFIPFLCTCILFNTSLSSPSLICSSCCPSPTQSTFSQYQQQLVSNSVFKISSYSLCCNCGIDGRGKRGESRSTQGRRAHPVATQVWHALPS